METINSRNIKVAKQVNMLFQLLTQELVEEEALMVPDLFEEWEKDNSYKIDKILKYGEEEEVTQIYKVIQDHVSQEDWTPNEYPSLYKKIGFSEGGVAIWVQPLGYSDAYNKGDIVSYNDILYTSTEDNNIWEPGIYGWKENK